MSPKEAAREFRRAMAREEGDPETQHMEADGFLCKVLTDLGYAELVAEFEELGKWYA